MTHPPETPRSNPIASDWLTIWQSEWAAMAVDREIQEAWLRMAAAPALHTSEQPCPQGSACAEGSTDAVSHAAPGRARPVPPAWPPAAAAAPDAQDAAIASLLDRVAELERRAGAAADPTRC